TPKWPRLRAAYQPPSRGSGSASVTFSPRNAVVPLRQPDASRSNANRPYFVDTSKRSDMA
ncbi:MAG TPA: hypothetical protein VKD71_07450, partial [Gemmataceae bacterium]|nr:hypothetical protein [Gemmataceae bacterium]